MADNRKQVCPAPPSTDNRAYPVRAVHAMFHYRERIQQQNIPYCREPQTCRKTSGLQHPYSYACLSPRKDAHDSRPPCLTGKPSYPLPDSRYTCSHRLGSIPHAALRVYPSTSQEADSTRCFPLSVRPIQADCPYRRHANWWRTRNSPQSALRPVRPNRTQAQNPSPYYIWVLP